MFAIVFAAPNFHTSKFGLLIPAVAIIGGILAVIVVRWLTKD